MISPLLLEDRKEEFMTVVESNVRAAQKPDPTHFANDIISPAQDLPVPMLKTLDTMTSQP